VKVTPRLRSRRSAKARRSTGNNGRNGYRLPRVFARRARLNGVAILKHGLSINKVNQPSLIGVLPHFLFGREILAELGVIFE
jgi:hypothetical protein